MASMMVKTYQWGTSRCKLSRDRLLEPRRPVLAGADIDGAASTDKLFVCLCVEPLTMVRNDRRLVIIGADIGILYSGDRQSGDARPSLKFFIFIQVLTLCAFIVDGAEFGRR